MKILVITPTFLPIIGGAEIGIYEIYKRLAQKHKVLIITPNLSIEDDPLTAPDDYYKSVKFNIVRYNDNINLTKIKGKRLTCGILPPFSISAVIATHKALKNFQPDIINVHYGVPTGLAGVYAKKIKKAPVVLSLVGRDISGPGTPLLWKKYLNWVCGHLDQTICISELVAKSINERTKTKVIPYGVNTTLYSPENPAKEQKINIPDDHIVLFTLQRLAREKRVDIVIKAFKEILRAHKKTILIVGGIGPEKKDLINLAKKLKIDHKIIFTGYIDEKELPQYFLMSDIFLFHSTFETFGITLAQAMSCGLPIISVDNTAIPELIKNDLNGYLVETFDYKKMAEMTIYLIKNHEKRKQIGLNNRKKALMNLDWDLVAKKYEKLFTNIIPNVI